MASTNLDIVMSAKDKASSKIKGLNSTIGGLKFGALSAIGSAAIGAIGSAVSGLGSSVVTLGKDFSAGMSEVGAISGATGADLQKLSSFAREMGATTQFSATEAADGLKYMAMAGWDAEQMTAGLPAVLNLAAASGENLGTTSDIVTDALSAFGMKAEEAGHFADVLATASSNSNTNVSMMGETFKYCAPVAGALGYKADDVAVAIGLMANAGIKGSQAGTALRGTLANLSKPSDECAAAMDELGISLTDSSGQMKPFDQLLGEMRQSFAGLDEAQKAQYATTIAGKNGMSGFLAMMNASDEDVQKLTQSIKECDGSAAKMAETMNDNLTGDLKKMNSAWEEVQLKLFDAVEPAMREIAQVITDQVIPAIDSFAQWLSTIDWSWISNVDWGPILSITGVVAGVIAAFGILGSIPNPFKIFSSGAKGAGSAIKGVLQGIGDLIKKCGQGVSTAAKGLGQGLSTAFKGLGSGISTAAKGIGQGIKTITKGLGDMGSQLMKASAAANPVNLLAFGAAILLVCAGIALIATQGEGVAAIFEGIGNAIGTVVESIGTAIATILTAIAGFAPQLAVLVTAFMEGFAQIAAFLPAIIDSVTVLIGTLGSAISEAARGIGEGIASIIDACAPIVDTLAQAFVEVVGIISNAVVQIVAALAPYIPEVTKMVEATSEAVQAVCDSFNTFVSSISPVIDSVTQLVQQLGDTFDQIFHGIGDVIEQVGGAISGVLDSIAGVISSIGTAAKDAGTGFDLMADGIVKIVSLNIFDLGASLGAVALAVGDIARNSKGLGDVGTQMYLLSEGLMTITNNLEAMTCAAEDLPYLVSQFEALGGMSEPLISSSASMSVFSQAASEMANSLVQSGTTATGFLTAMSLIGTGATNAESGVSSLASSLGRVPGIMTTAGTSFTMFGTLVSTTFTTTTKAAQTFQTQVSNAFKTAANNVRTSCTQIITSMSQATSRAASAGMQTGQGYANGIRSGMSTAVGAARNAINSVMAILRSGVGSTYAIGYQIGAGLANGMNSALGAIRSAANRMIAEAERAAAAKAKVHSPSRVFMEMGAYIGEGLQIGIESMIGDVAKASRDLVNVPHAQQLGFAGVPSGVIQTGRSQMDDNREEVFHFHLELDGDEVAEKTYRRIGRRIEEDKRISNRLRGER